MEKLTADARLGSVYIMNIRERMEQLLSEVLLPDASAYPPGRASTVMNPIKVSLRQAPRSGKVKSGNQKYTALSKFVIPKDGTDL
jgi:hypothetical protein